MRFEAVSVSLCLQKNCWRCQHSLQEGDFESKVKYFFLTLPFAIKKSSGCLFNDNDCSSSPHLLLLFFENCFPLIAMRWNGKTRVTGSHCGSLDAVLCVCGSGHGMDCFLFDENSSSSSQEKDLKALPVRKVGMDEGTVSEWMAMHSFFFRGG
jgi:hypothetical protein